MLILFRSLLIEEKIQQSPLLPPLLRKWQQLPPLPPLPLRLRRRRRQRNRQQQPPPQQPTPRSSSPSGRTKETTGSWRGWTPSSRRGAPPRRRLEGGGSELMREKACSLLFLLFSFALSLSLLFPPSKLTKERATTLVKRARLSFRLYSYHLARVCSCGGVRGRSSKRIAKNSRVFFLACAREPSTLKPLFFFFLFHLLIPPSLSLKGGSPVSVRVRERESVLRQ